MNAHEHLGSGSPVYAGVMLAAVAFGAWRVLRRRNEVPGLGQIYLGAVCGGFIGAKLVYLLSEWSVWRTAPDPLAAALTGKSIVGGLLGGYAGVELTKLALGIRARTGDRFALALPWGMILARIGCLHAGCCLGAACDAGRWYALTDAYGVARWPAVPAEMLFNLIAGMALFALHRRGAWRDRLFDTYCVGYGLFRLVHEFFRDTPGLVYGVSGYQIFAAALATVGFAQWIRHARREKPLSEIPTE